MVCWLQKQRQELHKLTEIAQLIYYHWCLCCACTCVDFCRFELEVPASETVNNTLHSIEDAHQMATINDLGENWYDNMKKKKVEHKDFVHPQLKHKYSFGKSEKYFSQKF